MLLCCEAMCFLACCGWLALVLAYKQWCITHWLTVHCCLQVDDLRGSPLSVGTLEEIIDEK
jgi:hypothetical protein